MTAVYESSEQREQNRRTVERFFATWDPDIDEFFTDDIVKEIPFATFLRPDGSPLRWEGKDELRKNFAANRERVVEYEWTDVTLFGTDDPDVFWSSGGGRGSMRINGVVRPYIQDTYYLLFELREGKIRRYLEIMNPLELLATVGGTVEVPPTPSDY